LEKIDTTISIAARTPANAHARVDHDAAGTLRSNATIRRERDGGGDGVGPLDGDGGVMVKRFRCASRYPGAGAVRLPALHGASRRYTTEWRCRANEAWRYPRW
jgi:hypothetical protein